MVDPVSFARALKQKRPLAGYESKLPTDGTYGLLSTGAGWKDVSHVRVSVG